MLGEFARLAFHSTLLAWEAPQVVSLRIAKLALGGPAAVHETQLMISEKVIAFGQAAVWASAGGSVASIVSAYRDKVSANLLRLT